MARKRTLYEFILWFLRTDSKMGPVLAEFAKAVWPSKYNLEPIDASQVNTDISGFEGILSENESSIQLALNKLDNHHHDDSYYSENEVDNLLEQKSDSNHTHQENDPTVPIYVKTIDSLAKLMSEIKSADGENSGLDADLLDGIDSSRMVYGSNARKTTPETSDLNNIMASGFYYAWGAANTPNSENGFLIHNQYYYDDTYALQLFVKYSSNTLFIRRKSGGTWQPWVDITSGSIDYINFADFDAGTGQLSLDGPGNAGAIVGLDGRYAYVSHSHNYAHESHNHDDLYYTETETDVLLTSKASASHTHNYAEISHTHDDRYPTDSELAVLLAGKSDNGHSHDSRYYTETEVDNLLSVKAAVMHTHSYAAISHTHDDRYYTESEIDSKLENIYVNNLKDVDTSGWQEGKILKFNSQGKLTVGTDEIFEEDFGGVTSRARHILVDYWDCKVYARVEVSIYTPYTHAHFATKAAYVSFEYIEGAFTMNDVDVISGASSAGSPSITIEAIDPSDYVYFRVVFSGLNAAYDYRQKIHITWFLKNTSDSFEPL